MFHRPTPNPATSCRAPSLKGATTQRQRVPTRITKIVRCHRFIPCSSILTPINHVISPSFRSDIMANESSNQRGGSGNFANDPERASEAGRKGGQQSHQGSGQSDKSQQGG